MAVNAGSVYAELILDMSKYEENLKKAENQMNQFGKDLEKVGKGIEKAGDKLSKYITAPILGVGIAATKLGMDFEAAMSRVQAISGATGTELEKLNEVALQLGADTAFSASEVASAMENLASAGFTTNEIIAAIPGNLDLAAASGADLATATDIAASILRGFQLDAAEAGRVADVLAEAANRTNAQVEDMGEAMKYIAPVANAMGLSLEETAAAVGLLANAGIKGSQAGTTLRGALTRLTKPTKQMKIVMNQLGVEFFDAQGNMKSLTEIIAELEEGTKGLTQEQKNQAIATLFGQEALSGMLVLIEEGPGALAELTKGFENSSGAAKEAADIMMNNTKGVFEEMMGALETAAINIFNIIAPVITDIATKIGELADKFSALPEETQKSIIQFTALAAAIGPVTIVFGKLVGVIGTITSVMSTVSAAIAVVQTGAVATSPAVAKLASVFTALTGPVGIVIAALAGLSAGIAYLWKTNEEFREKVIEIWGSVKELFSTVLEDIKGLINAFIEQAKKFWNIFADDIKVITDTLWETVLGIVESALNLIKGVIDIFMGLLTGDWQRMSEGLQNIWAGLWNGIKTIVEGAWNLLSGAFNILWDAISKWFIGLIEDAIEWGINVVEGLWEGIKSMGEWIGEKVKGFAEGIANVIKGIFGIESPSKLMALYGQYIVEGLAEGINNNTSKAVESANKLANAVRNALQQINDYVTTTVSIIQKEFELWKLENEELANSSLALEKQLAMQEERQRLLTEQIKVTEKALMDIAAKYGESSMEALKYKEQLLDLQIAQQKLKDEINETVKALNNQLEAQWKITENGVEINGVVYGKSSRKSYNDRKKKEMEEHHDEIVDIAERHNVDMGVAYDMWKQNELDKILGKVPKYALGTDFHLGGLALVGEQGPELIELPRGAKVYPANETKDMLKGNRGTSITQNIHIYSPEPLSPSEIARKNLQVSRQLAMEWGV